MTTTSKDLKLCAKARIFNFNKIRLRICSFGDTHYILIDTFKNKNVCYYFLIPRNIIVQKTNKELTFFLNSRIECIEESVGFYNNLCKITNLFKSFYVKILILKKSIGWRIRSLNNNRIQLKLGFSHLCYVDYYQNTKLNVKKNTIRIASVDQVRLGNLVHIIRKLRMPDPYRGKGISHKGEILKFKEINKK